MDSVVAPPRGKASASKGGRLAGAKRTQPPSSLESMVDVKREVVAPSQVGRPKKALLDSDKKADSLADQMSHEPIEIETAGIPNDESNTKADENEQQILLQDYPKNAFIIPSCSAWFSLDTIHEIEMHTLPEFFCGKFPHKNPATYLDYRNYIIKLYRESPNAYLSATVCRKNLPGDVCSIIRLHAFLEHWGLINFNVDPMLKPAKL